MASRDTLAWHWVRDDGMLQYVDNVRVEAGKTYSAVGTLELCANGMHGSIKPLDALQYAPGALVCRVRLHGTTIEGEDKLCARHRTVLWLADGTTTLHEFAVWCAEGALTREREHGREPHADLWRALEVRRAWLRGDATDRELREAANAAERAWDAARGAAWAAARGAAWAAAWAAAWDAAWDAARGAAWAAARGAAWAAARGAAWDAARGAAWDAARAAARAAAWAAAWAAARAVQNTQLETMLLALAPQEG